MTANLPETLDGLVLNTADQAEALLASLRRLDEFVAMRLRGRESVTRLHREYGHLPDGRSSAGEGETPAREDVERMAQCVCSAIGLVEGACRSLESAKQLRSRCQEEE